MTNPKPRTTPSVGRIVHYVSHGTPNGEYTSECRAAIVTEVGDMLSQAGASRGGYVGLCVLNPTGQFFNRAVKQDEIEKRGGTWHWPERAQ